MEHIFSVIRSVLNRWKLWTVLPLLAMGLVFYLTRSQPKIYVSEATLNISFQSSKGLSLTDDVLQQYEINQYFENLIQLTRSRKNLELVRLRVLKDFVIGKNDFIELDSADNIQIDTLHVLEVINQLTEEKQMLNLLNPTHAFISFLLKKNKLSYEDINNSLGMGRVGKSNYINVIFEANNPLKAAYINTLILETMVNLYKSISKHRSEFDREMFEKLVANSKSILDQKIKSLEDYKINQTVINLPEHTKAIVNQIVNMEIQLSHLKEIKASKQKAVERILKDYSKELPLPVDLNANKKILELKRQLSKKSSSLVKNRFNPEKNIDVAKNEEEIESLKNQISQEITNLITDTPYDPRQTKQEIVYRLIGYQLDVEMAEEAIPVVQNEINRIMNYAKQFAPLESNIGSMENEIYVAQQGYLILLNKLNLAKSVAEGKGEGEIHTVDLPSIPLKPKPGKRAILVVISGMVVFLFIVVSLVLIEVLDASISTVERFERVSLFKVISAIPDMNSQCLKNGLVKPHEAQQILNHQIKALRKEVLTVPKEESIILWLSGHQMEGKQWLTSKVIESLLSINKKVLLIHGDPMDGDYPELKIPVLGYHPMSIMKANKSGILMLTEIGMSPLEMIDESNWKDLFGDLKKIYDYIFIVSPPIEKASDWKEWAIFAKSAVYMFRANKTFQTIDMRSMQRIEDSSLNVIGAVLNKIEFEKMESYIGDIPKRRSRLRAMVKHLIERDFGKMKDQLKLRKGSSL